MNAQEPLPDETTTDWNSKSDYDDEEKVEFPSGRPLPTFSAAFGNDVPPSQMRFGPPRLGPRFNNPSIEPFDPQPPVESDAMTTYSKSSASRTNSSVYHGGEPLKIAEWNEHARSASIGSQRSMSSYKSNSSQHSHKSNNSGHSFGSAANTDRKWMIE